MSTKSEIDLIDVAGGCGASPEGERGDLPAARRLRSRSRFAIGFPTR
jgi:hypothetical protein